MSDPIVDAIKAHIPLETYYTQGDDLLRCSCSPEFILKESWPTHLAEAIRAARAAVGGER